MNEMKMPCMHAPYTDDETAAVRELREDPDYASCYINSVICDGDQQELIVALRRFSQAFGCTAPQASYLLGETSPLKPDQQFVESAGPPCPVTNLVKPQLPPTK